MDDFLKAVAKYGGLVTEQYAATSQLEWKLAVNEAVNDELRKVKKDVTESELRSYLYGATAGIAGIPDESYRKQRVESAVSAYSEAKFREYEGIARNEFKIRSSSVLNSFMLGDSTLSDLDAITDDVFKDADEVFGPEVAGRLKRDTKSQAALYGLSLLTPEESEFMVREKYKDVLTPDHLKELLRINENKRSMANSKSAVASTPKLVKDVMNNVVTNRDEFNVRAVAAGVGSSSFNNVSLYGEMQKIRNYSREQLLEITRDSESDPFSAAVAAERILAIDSKAGENVVEFARASDLALTILDYGSQSSLLTRAGEAAGYAQRFETPVTSLLTKQETNEIKQLFESGNVVAQYNVLKAFSVIEDPFLSQAVVNDLDNISPLARAEALIAQINGNNSGAALTAINRGSKMKSSPNNNIDAARRVLKESFYYLGEKTSESVAKAVSYHATGAGYSIKDSIKEMFGGEIGHVAGKYVSAGKAYSSWTDYLYGNYAPGYYAPYSALPAPAIMTPPGMSLYDARKSYETKMRELLPLIPNKQNGMEITLAKLEGLAYPVNLGVNLYAIMIPSVNGTPVPLLDKNNVPVKISLDYR